MKKIQRILSVMLAIIMMFSVAACGNGGKQKGKAKISYSRPSWKKMM